MTLNIFETGIFLFCFVLAGKYVYVNNPFIKKKLLYKSATVLGPANSNFSLFSLVLFLPVSPSFHHCGCRTHQLDKKTPPSVLWPLENDNIK